MVMLSVKSQHFGEANMRRLSNALDLSRNNQRQPKTEQNDDTRQATQMRQSEANAASARTARHARRGSLGGS
jgi:hypothetical protein